jgi:hypothetical protein
MTRAAETAKVIRTTLKQHYPAVGFTVKSHNFAGGDSVNVDWTDGPTTEAINRLIAEYESGTFDPTCDLYEYRTDKPNHPTAKYVGTSRHFSPAVYAAKRAELVKKYGIPEGINDDNDRLPENKRFDECYYFGQFINHELHKTTFSEADEISEDDLEAAAAFMDKYEQLTAKNTAELIVLRSQNKALLPSIDAELNRRGVLPIDYVGGNA